MLKKSISMLLVMVIVLTVFTIIPTPVFAATSGVTGDCSWSLDNSGVLTISGNGTMDDYSSENASPWGENVTSVIIENGVTSIGNRAFYNCTKLTSVTIQNNVTSIGNHAFYKCMRLGSVNIGNGVTSIGNGAFEQCTGLTNVTIPDNVTTLGENIFLYCTNLKCAIVGNGIHEIPYLTFTGCTQLETIEFGNHVEVIGSFAFQRCTSLKTLTFPDSLKSIGLRAFEDCDSLVKVIVSDGAQADIGERAFISCDNLQTVEIGNNTKSIGYYAFAECRKLSELSLGNGLKTITDRAFYYCLGIKTLRIPDSVNNIGDWAFWGCNNLTELTIGRGLSTIRSSVFRSCKKLNTVYIPENIREIYSYAFEGDESLKTVFITKNTKLILNNAFYSTGITDVYYSGSEEEWINLQANIKANNGPLLNATIHYNYQPTSPVNSTDVDDYIIEQVAKYASDSPIGSDQYNAILNENASNETKLKNLNELFKNYGFTDANEGVQYYRDTNSYRNDYRFLTTDDAFCAYNFYYYLNYTTAGQAKRGLLWADGLLLNGELSSYLDVSTYTDEDYPSVKKNKSLLRDFLAYKMSECDVLENQKKVADTLTKLLKLNGIAEDYQSELLDKKLSDLMKDVLNAKNKIELENAQSAFATVFAEACEKANEAANKDTTWIQLDDVSKAMKYASPVFGFAKATADDILQMINLNKEVAVYQNYSRFLNRIANCDYASKDMRYAAYSLLDDIDNGYINHIVSIFGNIASAELDFISIDKDLWEQFFGNGGALIGDTLGTISLASFISNIVIDTGDFVEKAAYVQGYAELSVIYNSFLQVDKTDFNSNPSKENAWQFFEDYTTLWGLRKAGEESYLKLNEFKSFFFFTQHTADYNIKKAVVDTNLELLEQKQFEFAANYEIPESVQYFSKAVINCPVDVYVYSHSGELVATLKDGVESDITNKYGRFAVMKQSYSGEYAKVVALNNQDDVTIKSVAHSKGLVDYSLASINDRETKAYSIYNVSVDSGAIISTSNNDQSYAIDYDGDGTFEVNGQLKEETGDYVSVSAIDSNVTVLSMTSGEQQLINISIAPDNASNQTVCWFTDKEDVVSINNGVVKALKPGEATVYAKAIDSEDVILAFEISVLPTIADVDIDGYININDVTAIQRHLVELEKFNQEQLALADTNGDGEINISDATYLQMYLAEYGVVLGKQP